MADVMFILILVAFFGACVGFVRICDRMIGVDDAASSGPYELDDAEEVLAA